MLPILREGVVIFNGLKQPCNCWIEKYVFISFLCCKLTQTLSNFKMRVVAVLKRVCAFLSLCNRYKILVM